MREGTRVKVYEPWWLIFKIAFDAESISSPGNDATYIGIDESGIQ